MIGQDFVAEWNIEAPSDMSTISLSFFYSREAGRE